MDDLFISLSKYGAGCHIGQQFLGAFGYADDVILVDPSKRSLYILLETCKALISSKYRVKFNPQKSKLIVFDNGDAANHGSIVFDGQIINAQSHDVHIGHIIGNNTRGLNITKAKDDLKGICTSQTSKYVFGVFTYLSYRFHTHMNNRGA